MQRTSFTAEEVHDLAPDFSGLILRPTDPGYDEARKVHNGLVDKHPALIARCRGTADIADAIRLGRQLGLEVAVKGGGHNVAGRATVEGGLVIDLSQMKGIHVDAQACTVRAQGGVTWAELNRETQLHGLAVTGGVVSSTGIAGLTLGGGLGWLMSRFGLALDNLLSVELVTADGTILTASADDNPDLFWALRGGGGNFGVASSFEYRLHPVGPTVTGGLILYPFERAGEVLRHYRGLTASLPEDLTLFAGLVHAPDGSGTKLAGMVGCHSGPLEDAEAAFAPVRALEAPVADMIGPMPYCAVNSMLDDAYPKGALNHWKSRFLAELSDGAIDQMVACFADCPTPMGQVLIEHFHGAATRVAASDTAFPHRSDGFNLVVLSEWLDHAMTDECVAWARDTYAAMQPFVGAGRYVNYLDDEEEGDPVAAAYGPNHDRLREIKTKYDPGNVFHLNQNIRPLD